MTYVLCRIQANDWLKLQSTQKQRAASKCRKGRSCLEKQSLQVLTVLGIVTKPVEPSCNFKDQLQHSWTGKQVNAMSCIPGLNRSPANTKSWRGKATFKIQVLVKKKIPLSPRSDMLLTAHNSDQKPACSVTPFCLHLLSGSLGHKETLIHETLGHWKWYKRSPISHIPPSSVPMEKPGSNYCKATGYKI